MTLQKADLGVVFALAIEAGCFVDRLRQVHVTRGDGFIVRQGDHGERPIVLVESGPGVRRAAKAAHAMIDAYRPPLVVSAGFAGGLDPQLQRHDLVVATSVVDAQGSQLTLESAPVLPWLDDVQNLHRGRLLTFDRIVRLREEKLRLGREHAALAVDMETYSVAEVCRQRGVEFLSVRVISDAVDDELPPDIGRLLAQKSFAGQLGVVVGSVFRRPAAVKDFFNLHQTALACSKRLAEFLAMLGERMKC